MQASEDRQCVAVCCRVLHCVAVRCSVLQLIIRKQLQLPLFFWSCNAWCIYSLSVPAQRHLNASASHSPFRHTPLPLTRDMLTHLTLTHRRRLKDWAMCLCGTAMAFACCSLCVGEYVNIHIYIYIYIYICIYLCICIYVYIYVSSHTV